MALTRLYQIIILLTNESFNFRNFRKLLLDLEYRNLLIKNLKVWGQLTNSWYYIDIAVSDNRGIAQTKYAYGNKSISYFRTSGTSVTTNQITVTQNGTYTVYVKDIADNETIQTIQINRIG